jgi:hypothetical protein
MPTGAAAPPEPLRDRPNWDSGISNYDFRAFAERWVRSNTECLARVSRFGERSLQGPCPNFVESDSAACFDTLPSRMNLFDHTAFAWACCDMPTCRMEAYSKK